MKTTIEHTGFGLIAWLESTRVRLPLKGVECRFDITSGIAAVEIDQIYLQENSKPLDCTYTFPLPAGAAVYRCEVDINGRVIRAIVEEKQAARQIFAQQKAKGHRAALVESERDNLFTLQLGNVQPGDMVIVRFAYVQAIERGAGEQRRLRIPVCPGVRYIPGVPLLRSSRGQGTVDDTDQVPDASRISPPRIDQFHPDAAYCAISGTLPMSDAAESQLSSPTHRTRARMAGANWNVELDDRDAVPDRDFVLTWAPPVESTVTPRAWGTRHHGYTYALVQLRAPQDVAIAEDFAQDFYFLVDRSGSMQGAKWTKTCVALTAFVRLLGQRDRVWITLFESSFKDFAEQPLPAHEVRDDRAFQNLVHAGTAGGTELLPAANHVLGKLRHHSQGRRSVIILITDGEVGNEAEVLQGFAKSPDTTIFTFGIDTAVNDALLRALAAQHGGTCVLQTPNDDIAATVAGLADRLRRPVITDLRLDGAWTLATKRLPALFRGETTDLVLRTEGESSTVAIQGRRADGRTESWNLPLTTVSSEAPRLLWVRERIATLEAAGEDAPALELAKAHNVLCKSAAFIAWDEAEKVQVATHDLYQPSMDQHVVVACAMPASAGAAAPAPMRVRRAMSKSAACAAVPPSPTAKAGHPADGGVPGGTLREELYSSLAPEEPAERGGLWNKLKSLFGGGPSANSRVADGVFLPRRIAIVLLAWKNAHSRDAALLQAFDQLMDALRQHAEVANESADDAHQRHDQIRQLLVQFAETHMTAGERAKLEAALEI